MKKIAAVLIAGGLLLTATGCSAQLSTAETCSQANAALAAAPGALSAMTNNQKLDLYYHFKSVADRASDELAAPLQDLTKYLAQTVKKNPDPAAATAMADKVQAAGTKLTKTCGTP